MKIGLVSTFSDTGYNEYAHVFVDGIEKYFDSSIVINLYTDNVKINSPKINTIPLENSIPDLVKFKNRNKNKLHKNFLFDAVRFSHKSYAIWHASENINTDILIWLDADTLIKKEITSDYLKQFLPKGYFTSYLGRARNYTETGFLAFNLGYPYRKEFFEEYKGYYDSDKIYTLNAFTDCHVYDATRINFENNKKIKSFNLTPALNKNNFNKTFVGHMIHFKGDKKTKMSQGSLK